MMFLTLSLNGLLHIIVMATALSTDEYAIIKWHSANNYRSFNYVVPFHYNLRIALTPDNKLIGECNATIYIKRATQNITLHASKYITILNAKLKSANSGIIYGSKTKHYDYDEEIVSLEFVEELLPDTYLIESNVYTLYMTFSNSIIYNWKELLHTWYINEKEDKKLMIATLMQPRRARLLFPCWDEPELSATFNISIEYDIDSKYKFLSNMPIREYELVNDHTMRTLFHTTPSMSTNDIVIMIYDVDDLFKVQIISPLSMETVVNMWCRPHLIPHMKLAQYVAENVIMYLENNLKIFENVPKVDYIAIPNFKNKFWQTWGLVFYSEADIIYNEELHPVVFKLAVMRSITHDITYQWFFNGNLFNPCWSPRGLNDGFIMFLETNIIDKVFPDSRIMNLFVVQVQHESRRLNTHFAAKSYTEYASDISKITTLSPFSRIIGAGVWRMLESVIPSNAFLKGLKAYLSTKSTYYNSKTPDDLWNNIQTAIDKLYLKQYDMNVKQMMDIWIMQEHSLVLNVTRDYSSGRVIISKEFHDKLDRIPYFIPVTYTKETDLDFNITLPNINNCLMQSNPKLEIQFNDKDKWIIVNIQQTGYYRVNYDTENWRKIARYLKSENYTNIHVLNRAQIIDDAFHFAIEKKLNVSIFWELASYLSREEDYVAWYPMIKVFEYISYIFAFTNTQDNLPKVLKEVLLKIENLFKHIKLHMYVQKISDNDFEKYLKQEIAKWECIIHNYICKELGQHQLQLHLDNPERYKILPGWQKWTYCNGLKTVKYKTWSKLWNIPSSIYQKKFDYKLLEFYSCSEDPETIINYLRQFVVPTFENYLFEDNENETSAQEEKRFYVITANIFLSTLARHAKNTTILKEILKNFKNIKHSRVSMNASLSVLINNAYLETHLSEIRQFAKKDMQQSLSNIEHKLRTRSLEIQNQLNFLQSLFEKPIILQSLYELFDVQLQHIRQQLSLRHP